MVIATSHIARSPPKPFFERSCGAILVSPLEITELSAARRLLVPSYYLLLHYILIADDPAMATRLNH